MISTSLSLLVLAVFARAQTNVTPECARAQTSLDSALPWVSRLYFQCIDDLPTPADEVNPWAQRTCVAAAVAMTPGTVRDLISCTGTAPNVPALSALPNLPFSVYESITQSTNDKVFINQQNLIDLVYSSIGTEGGASGPVWPTSANEVIGFITPIFTWTATGTTIPYSHFSDWLKFSPERPVTATVPVASATTVPIAITTVLANATTDVVASATTFVTDVPASTPTAA